MPFLGETLSLSYLLLDGDATKFCRAVLTDPDGIPLAASPVPLTNLGGGKYSSDAVTMPATDYVEVTYEPYDDLAYTIPDPDHLLGTDVFALEVPDAVIVAKLDQILEKLNGLALPGSAMKATLIVDRVKEIIQDVRDAKTMLTREDVKSIIEKTDQLGIINNTTIKGIVDDEC